MRFIFYPLLGFLLNSRPDDQSGCKGSRFFTGLTCVFISFGLILAAVFTGCGFWVKPHGTVVSLDSQAPGFSLPDQRGQTVTSAQLLSRGPVMIVFYRGHW